MREHGATSDEIRLTLANLLKLKKISYVGKISRLFTKIQQIYSTFRCWATSFDFSSTCYPGKFFMASSLQVQGCNLEKCNATRDRSGAAQSRRRDGSGRRVNDFFTAFLSIVRPEGRRKGSRSYADDRPSKIRHPSPSPFHRVEGSRLNFLARRQVLRDQISDILLH